MTHPSMEGLRSQMADVVCVGRCDDLRDPDDVDNALSDVDNALKAQAAYLTEHGVLLSGEGLVRLEYPSGCLGCRVLVPQDGDSTAVCAVEVGVHPGPLWRDRNSGLVVCARHRAQYDERPDLGPFDWEALIVPVPQDDET